MSDSHFFNQNFKTLVINSNDLINGYYDLPEDIPYTGVRLSQLLFPNVFYNIDETNHNFKVIQKSNLNVLKPYTFQIPNGFYDAFSFATTLQGILNTAPPELAWVGTWTVAVNETTLRMSISNPDANNDFIIDSVNNNPYDLIGFNPLSTVYGKNKSGVNAVNLSDRHTIILKSETLGQVFGDVYHSSFPNDQSLMHIAFNLNGFGVWTSSTPNSNSFYRVKQNETQYLRRIHLDLIDTNGRSLNLHGIPYYVCLELM